MNPQGKPIVLILVKRIAIFAVVLCVVSLFYWIVGSESSFLDETEAMLIGFLRFFSLCVIASSGFGAMLSLCFAIARRYRLRILGLLGYVAAAAIGTGALFLAQTVAILSRGLR